LALFFLIEFPHFSVRLGTGGSLPLSGDRVKGEIVDEMAEGERLLTSKILVMRIDAFI